MQFMVECRLKPGTKNTALEMFEVRGPNRNPGVRFRGAWIGVKSDVVFVLVESDDEALVAEAGRTWPSAASLNIHPVHNIEQI